MPLNPDSILDSTKQVLGLAFDYTAFDLDVVMAINSSFGPLGQIGVGPSAGFQIEDNTALWSDVISDPRYTGMVKQYVWMDVRQAFDPPATGFAITAIQQRLNELIWRINVAVEQTLPSSVFWDLTGLSDFPSGAVTGDWGVDFDDGDAYSDNSETVTPGMWDLTGLSDFPSDSLVGDIGFDSSSGDVYKRDS